MEELNNKPYGYWNIKENCFEEAKKYKNKFELDRKSSGCYQGAVRKYGGAYNSARKHGWVNLLEYRN
jgi:hypothetical protein